MRHRRLPHALLAGLALIAVTACSSSTDDQAVTRTAGVTVTVSGGFDTDPRDGGRPVVLIAAALDVPTETFRTAFSGVNPADPDDGPTGDEAQANKAALLSVLGPLGITNDQLDAASDHYRYNGSAGETWPQRPATATAVVVAGVVTGITLTDPGVGYTSEPVITVTGGGDVTATATLSHGTDLATNGSLAAITLS